MTKSLSSAWMAGFFFLSSAWLGSVTAGDYVVAPLREELAAEYDLDQSFYGKATEVEGILIATSERVPDLAHLEAAYQFGMIMQRISPPIAQRIRDRKVLCILIGHDELTNFHVKVTGDDKYWKDFWQRLYDKHADTVSKHPVPQSPLKLGVVPQIPETLR